MNLILKQKERKEEEAFEQFEVGLGLTIKVSTSFSIGLGFRHALVVLE